jgi:hypothetical protein
MWTEVLWARCCRAVAGESKQKQDVPDTDDRMARCNMLCGSNAGAGPRMCCTHPEADYQTYHKTSTEPTRKVTAPVRPRHWLN